MKRILAGLLSCVMLFTGCTSNGENDLSSSEVQTSDTYSELTTQPITDSEPDASTIEETMSTSFDSTDEALKDSSEPPSDNATLTLAEQISYENSEEYVQSLGFLTLSDPDLLQYVEDTVYSELVYQLDSDDYIVESVQATYMPEEYYAEVEFNSQENIYFGYKSSELDEVFQGTKYIFTLDENGQTTVQEMETLEDDTYDEVVKNVAIGAGVILVCVTVSVVSAGVGAPAVSLVFAASAKTATTFAVSSAAFGGVSAAFVKGIETRNVKETIKAAALGASDGFKWGAISGAVVGGASEGFKLAKSGKAVSDAVANGTSIEIGQAGEAYAQEFYKGETQLSYLAGEEVPYSTPGATRPDITIKHANGTVEAVEVKACDAKNHLSSLKRELKRQVGDRVANLPEGSTQRIALVTKGRGYSAEFTNKIVDELQTFLFDVYGGKIPIDVI